MKPHGTYDTAFHAGAASRDAEVAELQTKVTKFGCVAASYKNDCDQLRAEIAELKHEIETISRIAESVREERDQLREDVKMLRDAIGEALDTYKIPRTARICEALAATEPTSIQTDT